MTSDENVLLDEVIVELNPEDDEDVDPELEG